MQKYYTSEEVCDILRITKFALNVLCFQGKIAYTKPGTRRLFTEADIETYLESGRKEAAK